MIQQLKDIAEKHNIEIALVNNHGPENGSKWAAEAINYQAKTKNKVFGEVVISIGVGSFHYSGIGRGTDCNTVEIAVISEKKEKLMKVGGSEHTVLPYVNVDIIPSLFEFVQTMETEDELIAFCDEFTQRNN